MRMKKIPIHWALFNTLSKKATESRPVKMITEPVGSKSTKMQLLESSSKLSSPRHLSSEYLPLNIWNEDA
jgi:hypothetical protein